MGMRAVFKKTGAVSTKSRKFLRDLAQAMGALTCVQKTVVVALVSCLDAGTFLGTTAVLEKNYGLAVHHFFCVAAELYCLGRSVKVGKEAYARKKYYEERKKYIPFYH